MKSKHRSTCAIEAWLRRSWGAAMLVSVPVLCQIISVAAATDGLSRDSTPLRPSFHVRARMILVPVTVTDAMDHPVTDLSKSSFRVFEDNVEQDVRSLHKEDGPASVGFIIDTSRSMTPRMAASVAAIEQFLKTNVPGDEYFLVSFADSPTLIQDFTGRVQEITAPLGSLQPRGWTALNDAIFRGVHAMRRAKNARRALIVLTDGADNFSRYSDREVRNLARESDLRVYSIGLFTRPDLLVQLSRETGGRTFWAREMSELPKIIDQLSSVFRNEYLLGYAPGDRNVDGKYHRIRVELVPNAERTRLHVSWRHGYWAPEL